MSINSRKQPFMNRDILIWSKTKCLENAWFFRNALVRANYNDLKNGVHETTEYLELFLRNLLLDEKNELHNHPRVLKYLMKNTAVVLVFPSPNTCICHNLDTKTAR